MLQKHQYLQRSLIRLKINIIFQLDIYCFFVKMTYFHQNPWFHLPPWWWHQDQLGPDVLKANPQCWTKNQFTLEKLVKWKIRFHGKFEKKPKCWYIYFPFYLSGLGLRFPSAPKALTASSTAFLGNPISIKVWTFPVGGGDDEVFLNRRLRLLKS